MQARCGSASFRSVFCCRTKRVCKSHPIISIVRLLSSQPWSIAKSRLRPTPTPLSDQSGDVRGNSARVRVWRGHDPGVAKKLGVHRRMMREALANAVPARRKKAERKRPRLSPVIPLIDSIQEAGRAAPRKQRHTAHRIYQRLRLERPAHEVPMSGSVQPSTG